MLFHTRLTKLFLLLVVAGLTTATGCQQRSVSDRPGEEGAMTQEVTVAISGMS